MATTQKPDLKHEEDWRLVSTQSSSAGIDSDSSLSIYLKASKRFKSHGYKIVLAIVVLFFLGLFFFTKSSSKSFLEAQTALCKAHNWEVYPNLGRRRKIYDLFMINTEIDWLEIRLGQMWSEVDYFVILEAPKTLFVQEN